ncbi:hypothetical protein XU18_1258 [Perkinsela sp. CCAP 1560/4]|nr:hypothetical protein XU18_1258 [Perkinsela sp. CCAP 1560/4]|eukprot:KNH08250.1 hypothetical protein XU18_1258 [Perkinsela sp. CCAP 1560/4]
MYPFPDIYIAVWKVILYFIYRCFSVSLYERVKEQMKSNLFRRICQEDYIHSSMHSSPVCVIPSKESAIITVSVNDHMFIYDYNRMTATLTNRGKGSLKHSHDAADMKICSSTVERQKEIVYTVDVSGDVHLTKLGEDSRDSILETSFSSGDDTFLKQQFRNLQPCWADILAADNMLLVSHGTLRTVHALSLDGIPVDYVKLGTYASAMAGLKNMPNVFATAEGQEVVIYDIRAGNHLGNSYAQRYFIGKEKLLTLTEGSENQIIASGYSRSLAFVDLRTNRMGPQMATKTKYEVNFVHGEKGPKLVEKPEDTDDFAYVAGSDAEMKILSTKSKKVLFSSYADDCWSGRPVAHDGLFAGISCRGSLLVVDSRQA